MATDILDGCAVFDSESGAWQGHLRDRFVFALLAETVMGLGQALGLRIGDEGAFAFETFHVITSGLIWGETA